ncbi:MAG: hypothetical protein NTU88_15625, partial [Armatimonadetes bacterium]|nr:hypothetical protein [Armatimonadota bacterium]
IFLGTSALILGDTLTGARLLRWSIISCDQIMGFRYYGIGNEYVGILIGASLMFPILFLRSSSLKAAKDSEVRAIREATSWLMAAWFAFVAFVIGYPGLGANVGGLITAVATFGVALMVLNGVRVRARHVIGLVALGFLVVAVFAAIDVASGEGSHLGRSVLLARTYGWDWLGYLIGGKILMHLGILMLPQTYIPILLGIPFFVLYGGRMKSEMSTVAETDLLYRTRGSCPPRSCLPCSRSRSSMYA